MLPDLVRHAMLVGSPLVSLAGAESHRRIPSIEQMERHLILEALEQTQGAVAQAAELLELSPATLYRKIKKFGLSRKFGGEES
jgi:transcriptional regulator of acetoin/glycerol metabolism